MTSSPRPLLGVSACIVDKAGQVLLVKRANAPFKGLMSLPGGKVRFGETLQDAVKRELLEEVGVEAQDLSFVTLHEVIDRDTHAVVAVYAGCLPEAAIPRARDDAAGIKFLGLDQIEKTEALGRTTEGLSNVARNAVQRLRRR